MVTPFEQAVKRCINTYQRLRAQHSDLRSIAQRFAQEPWLPAFDESGQFIGVIRSDSGLRLTANENCVRIGNKEWR